MVTEIWGLEGMTTWRVEDITISNSQGDGFQFVTVTTVPDTPATGDAVWIEAPNTPDCRAWSAKPDHPPAPLNGVTRVDDSGEVFTVHGDRKPLGSVLGQPQPWNVRCRKDGESTDTMLRGIVEG